MGLASLRKNQDDPTELRLQLQPGESILVRTLAHRTPSGPRSRPWEYLEPVGKPVELTGTWKVTFPFGGPVLPKPFETPRLTSWTEQADPETQRFAGTVE